VSLTRRTLAGVPVLAVGVPFLAACGDDPDPDTADEPLVTDDAPSGSDQTVPLGPVDEVPVGGGKIYPDPPVVVTQPAAEEYHAFSSFCTHRGCPVSDVTDGLIQCACHGSQYSIEDGSVVRGPAPDPLVKLSVRVEDGQLRTTTA
jgi:Rieske Fe-S protein